MPGPAQPNILETVRSSCKRVSELHAEHVRIDQPALEAYAAMLVPEEVKSVAEVSAGNKFPIKFDSQTAEINFLALYHLLRFGSGYDELLKTKSKRDTAEAVQFGLLGMHLGAARLDGAWMRSFNTHSVHNFFGIESHEEAPIPDLPGVTMSKPGPLHPLVTSIVSAVVEAGNALGENGHASLADLITSTATDLHKKQHPAPAAALVAELVESIPGFQDSGLYDGSRVEFARKAQALVAALAVRFGQEDPCFAFSDTGSLTGDSGPIVPAVLRTEGVVQLSGDLAATVDSGAELPPGPHERALRASAVTACDALAAAVGSGVTANQVGQYLAYLAEEGQELAGKIKPHVTRGTQAY